MCKDNNIPILVFSIDEPENIKKAICGEPIGTIVKEEEAVKEVLKNCGRSVWTKSAAIFGARPMRLVRVGRANPAVLDKVMVDYYGAPTAINQLAAVSVAEARVSGDPAVGCVGLPCH